MAMREQPCPYRIIDDFGGAFSMGCFAGCILHFIRGFVFSPKKERFYGGILLLKRRAPVLGGSFALWGGLFSLTDCTLMHLRNKEDYLNPIAAGFLTGGFLAIRGKHFILNILIKAGARIAFRNAIFGGIILGMIQLVEIAMTKMSMRSQMIEMQKMQQEQIDMMLQQQQEFQNRKRVPQ